MASPVITMALLVVLDESELSILRVRNGFVQRG
jgi:hypothetical protein